MKIELSSAALFLTVCMGASIAQAQSLTRVQGAGGRQTPGNLGVIGFSPDERFVYVIGDDAVGGDSNGFMDVVRQDRWTGVNTVVSLGVGGTPLNDDVASASLSANGTQLYMMTPADNLGFTVAPWRHQAHFAKFHSASGEGVRAAMTAPRRSTSFGFCAAMSCASPGSFERS